MPDTPRKKCLICGQVDTDIERFWCWKCDRRGINEYTINQIKNNPRLREINAKIEWKKCSLDLLYWLDSRRHIKTDKYPEGLPYVMTQDPHPMYKCVQCTDSILYTSRRLNTHLKLRHNIHLNDQSTVYSFFEQIPHIRPFPTDLLDAYIADIAKVWLTDYLVAIQKSRDMMATWMIVAFYTWDTVYHKGRQNIFQSEDATKTLELVKRAYFIWSHQPKFLKIHQVHFAKADTKSGAIYVDTMNSEILGFPQGADQIRGLHPSGVFQDEAVFQVEAAAAFSTVKPAIEHGGRFTTISTARPGWFQHVCQDTLDLYGSEA